MTFECFEFPRTNFGNLRCNLYWANTFCTGVIITLFALLLHLNCNALSQSESSDFSMYIMKTEFIVHIEASIRQFHFGACTQSKILHERNRRLPDIYLLPSPAPRSFNFFLSASFWNNYVFS